MLKILVPTSNAIYADQANELAQTNINWRDVSSFDSSCQVRKLQRRASNTDLEIIHFLWVKNAGRESRAEKKIKVTKGDAAYRSAVETHGGGAFDCQFETRQYINELSQRN